MVVLRPVLPPPSQPFSSTATLLIPCSDARYQAVARPWPPPPTITTSYDAAGSGLRHRACHPGPKRSAAPNAEASSAAGGYLPSDIVLTTLGHAPPGMPSAPSGEVPGDESEFPGAGDGAALGGELLASDAILAALFPHDELRLLVFHRRVTPAVATDGAAIEAALRRLGSLEPVEIGDAEPPRQGVFGVYLGRRWFRFTPASEVRGIDARWLQEHVLAPTFGIDDPEQTRNVDYISAMLGAEQVARRCDEAGGVGFVLHPVTIETMMSVAAARQIMPPKSTYFHPKPRSGVFLRFQ